MKAIKAGISVEISIENAKRDDGKSPVRTQINSFLFCLTEVFAK